MLLLLTALAIVEQFKTHLRRVEFHLQPELQTHELIPLFTVAPSIPGQKSWQTPPFQK
jgi:hypothetical protein